LVISSQGVQIYHSTRVGCCKKKNFLCFIVCFSANIFESSVLAPRGDTLVFFRCCCCCSVFFFQLFLLFFLAFFSSVFSVVFSRCFTVFLHLAKVLSTNILHIPAFCGICSSRLQEYAVSTYDHQVNNRPLIELQRHFLDILVFFGCRRRTGGNSAELAGHTKRSFVGVAPMVPLVRVGKVVCEKNRSKVEQKFCSTRPRMRYLPVDETKVIW